jgi:hypothetical protein
VTLKLGQVLRHHAAHAPGDSCPATRPETALHIDCKLALAVALRAASGPGAVLSIVQTCSGANGEACAQQREREWARDWDAVSVEHRVASSLRPDIVLHRAGAAVAAVEILVSNEVTSHKAQALAALGVPWIEVPASTMLAARNGWSVAVPLTVARETGVEPWRCPVHDAAHRAALASVEARRARERESSRDASVLRAARVVDIYHAGGARERFIYRVTELLTDGKPDAIRLQRGGAEIASIPVESFDGTRTRAWATLRLAFVEDLARFTRRPGSFTDSPMHWAQGDVAERIVAEALADHVGRDPTPLATRYPRRWFYTPDQQRWFLPADMRDVHWDRERLDPFDAHPAWREQRHAVRERPAPEGSWPTPVFASPPSAVMFRDGVRSVERAAGGAIAIVEVGLSGIALDRRRVIVVLERAVADEAVESLDTQLGIERVDAVWLSSPRDWTPALAKLVWLPSGRDWRGRGGVVVDGLGVFKADQFARAWAKQDRRLEPEPLRHRMAPRVARLSASRTI